MAMWVPEAPAGEMGRVLVVSQKIMGDATPGAGRREVVALEALGSACWHSSAGPGGWVSRDGSTGSPQMGENRAGRKLIRPPIPTAPSLPYLFPGGFLGVNFS